MSIPPKHQMFTNGNQYLFLGYPKDFVVLGFKGRWHDLDLKFKESVCYFKEFKLNKGDKFVVTNLNFQNKNDPEPHIPKEIALFCYERNFSFLIHYEYFFAHSKIVTRTKYYVKNKSKKLAQRGWHVQSYDPFAPVISSPFWWLSGAKHKNYNDIWNQVNV